MGYIVTVVVVTVGRTRFKALHVGPVARTTISPGITLPVLFLGNKSVLHNFRYTFMIQHIVESCSYTCESVCPIIQLAVVI